MEYNDSFYYMASGFLHGITHLVVIVACIVLVMKQKSAAAILMLIASVLTLLFSVLSIVWTQLAARSGAESLLQSNKILSIAGTIPYILFAVGLLWFAIKHKKSSRIE